MRGRLIVFEAADGAGKTTQSKKLVGWLNSQSRPAEWRCFPDRTTPIGKKIAQYIAKEGEYANLDKTEAQRMFSDNRREVMPAIREALERGVTVVLDRYCWSGRAYGSVAGDDENFLARLDDGLPYPDLVIYLQLPVEIAVARLRDNDRYNDPAFQQGVVNYYERVLGRYALNASGTVDEVFGKIVERYDQHVKDVPASSLASLDLNVFCTNHL